MSRIQVLVFLAAVAAIVCPAQALETRPASPVPEQPRFHPDDIVRQVRSARRQPVGVESPAFDGEFLVDTSVTCVPAHWNQDCPVVSFDGVNFLVVWADERRVSDFDIYGCRVAPDGSLLDSLGFVITSAPDDQMCPDIAFDGVNYLIVWQDWRSGSSDIYAARVTPAGCVLDTAGITVAMFDCEASPAVTFNGENYLVVWDDYSGGIADVLGARVTMEGIVLDPRGFAVTTAPECQGEPAASADGQDYLVVWNDYRRGQWDIYGARVTAEGRVLDTAGIPIFLAAGAQTFPAVCFDGYVFLVVWMAGTGDTADILGVRVSRAGLVLDSGAIPICSEVRSQCYPSVGFDGANFLIAWDDHRGVPSGLYMTRVSSEGIVLDTTGLTVTRSTSNTSRPALACGDSCSLIVWSYWDTCYCDEIAGARVTQRGEVLDSLGIALTFSAQRQLYPAACFDGTNYLVVWQDRRAGRDYDIYGARVASDGVVLDPAGFPVSTAPDDQRVPRVAYDGMNFMVVWEDERRGGNGAVFAARVTPSGQVLDTAGIDLCPMARNYGGPKVGFNGHDYLVVWGDETNGDIWGTRVSCSGRVLDPGGIAVCTLASGQYPGAVGAVDTTFMVAWSDGRGNVQNFTDVYCGRVSASGEVLDPLGILVSSATWGQFGPSLATDGAGYLVAWTDQRDGTGNPDVYGARVKTNGDVLDPEGIPIAGVSGAQQYPGVAFSGEDFRVVWEDHSSGAPADIYGATVSTGGVVRGAGPLVTHDGNQLMPALAAAEGEVLLLYHGWTATVGRRTYNGDRIWGRLLQSTAVESGFTPGTICKNQGTTIVRGCLFLPSSLRLSPYSLLSIDGRKVMELQPGANDVRHLSPGVYFVREEAGSILKESSDESVVRKVLIQR